MDRRKIKKDLLHSGFADMQSEALSYLFAEMATKEDVRELRSEMHGEFRAVRGEMQVMKAEMHADISDLGKQLMDAITSYQNRLFTHVLALIGALTAIMTLLLLLIR